MAVSIERNISRKFPSSVLVTKSRNKKNWLCCLGAVFCFLLADIVKQWSSDRGGLLRQHSAVAIGSMHRVELYAYRSSTTSSEQGTVRWSAWDDFPEDSNLMLLEDDKLISKGKIVPINTAHKQGLLHRGIWVAVLRRSKRTDDDDHEILLLRRAATLKTCPNAWGLCGEHSDPGEDWVGTARRAIQEELQLDDSKLSVTNLLPAKSVLVRTPYTDLGRRDLQATGILAVVVTEEEANSIQPDDEVAEMKWVPINELETMHACNDEISALAKLMAQRLKQLDFSS